MKVNPPKSWPWKHNGTTIVAAVMIHKVMNSRTNVLQKKIQFEKKVKTLYPIHLPLQESYVTITILEWLVSKWHTVHVWQKSLRKNILGYFRWYPVFWLLRNPSWKATHMQELVRHFMLRLSSNIQNRTS